MIKDDGNFVEPLEAVEKMKMYNLEFNIEKKLFEDEFPY
jgi:hypothetical protein